MMTAPGITLDTGALIALERNDKRMRTVTAQRDSIVTVPAVVLAEWWRGSAGQRVLLESPLVVEPTTARIARLAGEALAFVRGTAVDAIVMASAAQRGDIVYTSDPDDLLVLQNYFRSVTVLRATGAERHR